MTTHPSLFKDRTFLLLFSGETISNLGDQFTLIALSWLVVRLTGSGLALGGVLALAGIPRAAMMLLGGAVSDRFSSRSIMLLSNVVRLAVSAILAFLTLNGSIQMREVYLLSFIFGVADAFFIPAQTSIVPRIVSKASLQLANTVIQGSIQLCQFVGPFLAGLVIAAAEQKGNLLHGVGLAFSIDAATFVISILTLLFITQRQVAPSEEGIWQSIVAGLKLVWEDRGLRAILLTVAIINFLIVGPYLVGIPLVAQTLAGGASSFGTIMSVWGIGTVVGYLVAGGLPTPKPEKITEVMLLGVAAMGVFLGLTLVWPLLWTICLFTFCLTAISGYVSISFITLVQRTIPEQVMGRIMSIIMLCSAGLIPLSELASGALMHYGIRFIFIVAGGLVVVCSLWLGSIKDVRDFGLRVTQSGK